MTLLPIPFLLSFKYAHTTYNRRQRKLKAEADLAELQVKEHGKQNGWEITRNIATFVTTLVDLFVGGVGHADLSRLILSGNSVYESVVITIYLKKTC